MTDPDPLYELLLRARPGELGPDVVAKLLRRPSWWADAACRGVGPAAFFPTRGQPLEPAREFCARCPVTAECLEVATAGTEVGIWAGTSERARRKMASDAA